MPASEASGFGCQVSGLVGGRSWTKVDERSPTLSGRRSRLSPASARAWPLAPARAHLARARRRGAGKRALSSCGRAARALSSLYADRGPAARTQHPGLVACTAGPLSARPAVALLGNVVPGRVLEHQGPGRPRNDAGRARSVQVFSAPELLGG